jgi:hypothetical protein
MSPRRGAAPQPEGGEISARSYEIQVKGTLSPTLVAAIEGFEVSCVECGRTTLIGWVTDQTRLFSTLEVLRDLNIELVSLNPGPDQPITVP